MVVVMFYLRVTYRLFVYLLPKIVTWDEVWRYGKSSGVKGVDPLFLPTKILKI